MNNDTWVVVFEFPFGDIMMNLDGFLGYTFKDDNDVSIAEAYFTGSLEGKKNLVKAKKWASYAAKHGSEKASEILSEIG